ncbi:hypothetical protein YC2023_089356 [Brassica napus]
MVGKEPEVEKKIDRDLKFEKQKEKKQKALKEKEMDNAAYEKREIQKQEEVKCLKREAAEAERKGIEEK